MAGPLYYNNVAAVIGSNVAPADNTIALVTATGSVFPTPTGGNYYYATLVHLSTGLVEIVKVTSKPTIDSLGVVRAQDGTSAASFPTGSIVELRVTAQVLRELDFRPFFGVVNGIATLDATGKLAVGQIPSNVPQLVGGKLNISTMPDAMATDAELAAYLPLAGGTVTGALTANGGLVVDSTGAGAVHLTVGNNARLKDGGAANAMILFGVEDATRGFIKFGNSANGFGWNGTDLVFGASEVWHAGSFNPATKLNTASPSGTGNLTMTGNVLSNQNFESTTQHCVLACTGTTGNIFLRPKGAASAVSQAVLDQAGLFTAIDVQSTSDRDLKDNLNPMEIREDLADQIELWSWDWKGTGAPGRGPVAQEVLEYAPQFVGRGGNGFLSLDKAGLALAAIPGIAARLRRLEAVLNVRMESCSLVN